VTRWNMRKWLWSGLFVVSLGVMLGASGLSWADQPATPPAGLSALSTPAFMPPFHLPGVNGTLVDSATLQGKVVVVRCWATW
jgi:cytochrome oxidase Cu insertion factor (SCO1/SenC/PrrC family)